MSIRDELWKRTIQSLLGGAVAAGLVFGGLSLLPENFSRLVWLPIAGLVFAVPYSILVVRIACLRCQYPFYKSGIFRIRLGIARYRTNHCPHCGVGLDADAGPG